MNEHHEELEEKIGYKFKSTKFLERALTHPSAKDKHDYERLEFLGDRVLGLVMAHTLFETFREENEGGLAKRFSALVQGKTLYHVALRINLGDHITMSGAERKSGGERKNNILSDSMEALLGAVFIDGGIEAARKVILKLWGDNITTLDEAPQDPKTALQEWVQARKLPLPEYTIIDKTGPDHDPIFTVSVNVEGMDNVTSKGTSRRQAEKTAARIMLKKLKKVAESEADK